MRSNGDRWLSRSKGYTKNKAPRRWPWGPVETTLKRESGNAKTAPNAKPKTIARNVQRACDAASLSRLRRVCPQSSYAPGSRSSTPPPSANCAALRSIRLAASFQCCAIESSTSFTSSQGEFGSAYARGGIAPDIRLRWTRHSPCTLTWPQSRRTAHLGFSSKGGHKQLPSPSPSGQYSGAWCRHARSKPCAWS